MKKAYSSFMSGLSRAFGQVGDWWIEDPLKHTAFLFCLMGFGSIILLLLIFWMTVFPPIAFIMIGLLLSLFREWKA